MFPSLGCRYDFLLGQRVGLFPAAPIRTAAGRPGPVVSMHGPFGSLAPSVRGLLEAWGYVLFASFVLQRWIVSFLRCSYLHLVIFPPSGLHRQWTPFPAPAYLALCLPPGLLRVSVCAAAPSLFLQLVLLSYLCVHCPPLSHEGSTAFPSTPYAASSLAAFSPYGPPSALYRHPPAGAGGCLPSSLLLAYAVAHACMLVGVG